MSRYLNLMVVSLMALFALACNDDSKGTDDSVDCETLSVNACSEHDECREISAALIDDKNECLLENEAVGCMAYDKPCPEAITLATDPEGALWYFGDQCIPAGWSMGTNSENEHLQNAETCSASTLDCTERSVSGCENDGKCALLEGRKVDEGDVCLEEKEPTGCDAKEPSCDDALTVARDKDETLWVFTSTCIPAGWSAETGEGYSQYANAELCDEDETPVDCTTLDTETCLAHDTCTQIRGRRIDEDLVCLDEREPVGCMDVEGICGDMMTLATAPDGSAWFFSNNCTPEDWATFNNEDYLSAPMCSDEETPVDCGTLDIDTCLEEDTCTQIHGSKIDEDRVCREEMEPVGCMFKNNICGDMDTLAVSPDRSSWYFSTNCIPEGWDVFTNEDYLSAPMCSDDEVVDCGTLDIDTCLEHDTCTQMGGRRFDPVHECIEDPEPVGCMDANTPCTGVILYLQDPTGTAWYFTNGCAPEEWETTEPFNTTSCDTGIVVP